MIAVNKVAEGLVTVAEKQKNFLENGAYADAKGEFMVPLGKKQDGTYLIRDLSAIPHILICGFSGTGKTSFVQTVLTLLINNNANVRLIIYDSKGIEYNAFTSLKQFQKPIFTYENGFHALIKYLSEETKVRFKKFVKVGSRDVTSFNIQCKKNNMVELPGIYVVIDDYAMLRSNKDDLSLLLDLIGKGRISGIHFWIVSSMVSSKWLSKELRSLVPCKISFYLISKAESKLFIDQPGAEELHIPGEIIVKLPNEITKCHCSYATYENIQMMLQDNAAKQAKDLDILADKTAEAFVEDNINQEQDEFDEYVYEAGSVIIESGRASIGIIQRKFGIGFNRAARIMNQLEDIGLVGPEIGTHPREILLTAEEWLSLVEDSQSGRNQFVFKERIKETKTNSTEKDKNNIPFVVQEIQMRSFADFKVGEYIFGISENQIKLVQSVMTCLGPGTTTAKFSGNSVEKVIYKKPRLFVKGYIQFQIKKDVNLVNENPRLLHVDNDNISRFTKIEFGFDTSKIIYLFLKQISEDISVPIMEV